MAPIDRSGIMDGEIRVVNAVAAGEDYRMLGAFLVAALFAIVGIGLLILGYIQRMAQSQAWWDRPITRSIANLAMGSTRSVVRVILLLLLVLLVASVAVDLLARILDESAVR
jgi:hypothetical protein